MWFRNLRIYRLSAAWGQDANKLNDLLAQQPLTPCGSLAMKSSGWVAPKAGAFVHAVNKQWLISLGVEQKLLPMSIIRQVTQERVVQMEAEQDRALGRKEVRDLRDNIIQRHIANGKIATRLGMTWNDRISFVLNDKMQIKRLSFLDIVKDDAEQSPKDADEQFDLDFVLMAGELDRLFKDLLLALGGEGKSI